MSEFFDKQFTKEFKQLMTQFKNETRLNLRQLPIPFGKPVLVETLLVRGIKDEKYQILNDKYVVKRKVNTIKRNIYKNSGELKGSTNYKAKEGNVLIITDENLRLPFRYAPSDNKLEYVDYRVENSKRSFIYSVPKKYLYRTQQTALVLSQYTKRSHFGGIQMMLTNGHPVYLYIVPLRSVRKADGSIPILVKSSTDYRAELAKLQQAWLSRGIIFRRDLLELQSTMSGGSTNLGYKPIEPTLVYEGVDEYSLEEREEMRKTNPY